ncbi:MAG: hypothetical protein FWD34_00320 [Oscillospiraceae bacterium]|nr:hypothetical protein [Oscillospiraceae bacterium]
MLKINYDVTLPETEEAFKAFWRKYSLKRTLLFSVVFLIGVGLFANMIYTNLNSMFGWIGAGLSLGMLSSIWLRPVRARKKLISTLEVMNEEKYTAIFDTSTIEIETIVADNEEEKIEKTTIDTTTEELYAMEKGELFLLFVNRSLIYVFPKRCMTEEEITALCDYFTGKKI